MTTHQLYSTSVAKICKTSKNKWSQCLLSPFGLSTNDDDFDLPSMYWTPQESIQTTFHSWICKMYNTCYSRSGINSMWILKNWKDILKTISSRLLSEYNNIKTYDFSTLYTSIPHTQLKSRLKNIVVFFSKKMVHLDTNT